MARTVRLTHFYQVGAAEMWAMLTDLDTLVETMNGLVTMRGLPSGRIQDGQAISVDVSLFGVLPWQPYRMEVVALDDQARSFQTSEHGVGVERWEHRLAVFETAQGCRVEEEIDIEAGWKTPFVAGWAKSLYSARHRRRLRLIG